jgi:transcriptional regulator GlxA family with amidase domain
MNRRDLLRGSLTVGVGGVLSDGAPVFARPLIVDEIPLGDVIARPDSLTPPIGGPISVAFVLSDGIAAIDFCGPWDIFETARLRGRSNALFLPYTVAATTAITASRGLTIVPNFGFDSAPAPNIIVVPGQGIPREPGKTLLDWLRRTSPHTDVTMSVCTGAFVLASAGLLNGKPATTHHNSYIDLAMQFPDIQVKRGMRFVETGNLATAGGRYSGIDLALRVVERYFGRSVAEDTASFTEYQGLGWTDMNSNQAYRKHSTSTPEHPICPVCEMEVDPRVAPKSEYLGVIYRLCMPAHKVAFETAPDRYLAAL